MPHAQSRYRVVPLVTVLAIAAIAAALGWYLRPTPTHDPSEFGLEPATSTHDEDGDGIDDSTDIEASARAYLATKPTYGSAYYAGGRPTDRRGVCTDVVDQALLGAGYDLQKLVAADVATAPGAYDIDVPDPNIDFRRVKNLRVWFDRHASQLTLDPTELDQWQAGDIVCWANHIGIVSSKRDEKGIALVLHHAGPWQRHFEENVLLSTRFGPLVAHWRL